MGEGGKLTVPLAGIGPRAAEGMAAMQAKLLADAKERTEANTHATGDYNAMKTALRTTLGLTRARGCSSYLGCARRVTKSKSRRNA